jgi:SAM-dependent methyltransferase
MTSSQYGTEFFEGQRDGSLRSAKVIVPLLLDAMPVTSVVDVGCGVGTWLSVFMEHGISDVVGVDGDYVDRGELAIPVDAFHDHDLAYPLRMNRRFDVALCLEVGEHLQPGASEQLVDSLTRLAPVVVFSAAIPGQGGHHHVNERWQSSWAAIFSSRGYDAFDVVRPLVWARDDIETWYAQNLLVFAERGRRDVVDVLRESPGHQAALPLSVVHPRIFTLRTQHPIKDAIYRRSYERLPRSVRGRIKRLRGRS